MDHECEDDRIHILRRVFEEFIGDHKDYRNHPGLDYKQIFSSPWAPNIELEKRHEELTQKICQWPLDYVNGGDRVQNDILVTCLGHSLMFSTDFITLKDPQRVSNVQLQYLKLLHRYLKFKYDNSNVNNYFHNGIMIGSYAREIMEIRKQRLPV